MGKYVSWDDLVARYKRVADKGGSSEVGSSFLAYAEAEIESRLGGAFTVPFSSNNVTAADLVIDLTIAKIIRFQEPKKYKVIIDEIDGRVKRLVDGTEPMVTTSGDVLFASTDGGAWSSTGSYHPVFGLEDYTLSHVSSDALQDEEDARW